uniref:Uncharacterized protein n=1 Tax=Arundo donax TaxID=35708 RepID=A0A0A9BCL2_ARUDO
MFIGYTTLHIHLYFNLHPYLSPGTLGVQLLDIPHTSILPCSSCPHIGTCLCSCSIFHMNLHICLVYGKCMCTHLELHN